LFLLFGCARKGDVVLEGRVFPPGKLDIPTTEEQPSCFVFRTAGHKLYVGTFVSRPTLQIPDWCLNPTKAAIEKHFEGEKVYTILEEKAPHPDSKHDGDDGASRGGLRVPFESAEGIFAQLSKRIIIVADTGKARFAILPGHRYKLVGRKKSTATETIGSKNVQVIYYDIHSVMYLGGADKPDDR